ncbi:MAG: DUF748 domain-containing protein [Methylovulum sp.]|nr:DUF748 domain-containing protein [Methylovulum sp.]
MIIVVSLVAITITVAFYSLPTLLKSKLPIIIKQETGRESSIARIGINLMPLSVSLQGFEIKENSGKPLASFDRLDVQIDALNSLKQTTLIIDKIGLVRPFVHIVRQKEGAFNISDLFIKKTPEKPAGNKLFPMIIAKLSLSEGQLAWDDAHLTQPFTETAYPLQLDVDGFSTVTNTPSQVKISLGLKSGERFNWTGVIGINPFHSQGHIKLEGFELQKLTALELLDNIKGNVLIDTDFQVDYEGQNFALSVNKARVEIHNFHYANAGNVFKTANFVHETEAVFKYASDNWELVANTAKIDTHTIQTQTQLFAELSSLTASAAYKLSYAHNKFNLVVNRGKIDGKTLQLTMPKQDKQLIKIPTITLSGIEFNLKDKKLNMGSVSANDAAIKAWLNPDGTINYQQLTSPATAVDNNGDMTSIGQKKTPWTIEADQIALNNGALDFEDRSLEKPFTFDIKPLNIELAHFSNQTGVKLPFKLAAGINQSGAITLTGDTVISPLSAQIAVDATNIDLEKFQTYFDKFIQLDIVDGKFAVDGQISVARQTNDQLDIKFNGNTGIADLLTRDRRVHKDFVKWQNLTLKELAIDLTAKRYTASALIIDKPYARVTIRKDKSVNFSDILITGESQPKSTQKKTAAKPPYFRLGKIQINEGYSDFTDLSLILPFSAHIQGLNGGANGVSSEKNSLVDVKLKGNAYDLAPVDVVGKISPYLGDYTVSINFKGLPMPLVSPYMVQFAGYKVEKGKMSLALNYKVENRQLTATNSLLIDQFELGEKVDNPNAVSIPIKLAIALLKDSNGRIKFDVPITGSLEDPKFNLGAIIVDALVNAISKVITSPFHALTSLTGHANDLSTVTFSAGSANLDQQQKIKLDDLARALLERPKLSLEIKGFSFQSEDWPAIRDDALYDQLKMRRATELNRQSITKIRSEYVELSKDDYQRLLADMFIEKFPLLAERSFFGMPQLKNPKSGNFYDIAKQKLMGIIRPEQERLKDLAAARAQALAKYIVQQGKVPQERVYILDTVVDSKQAGKEITSTLSLQAD